MRVRRLHSLLLVVAVLALGACAHKVVSRIPEDSTTDLSGRWNDTDSRLVSDEMIHDCIGNQWMARHMDHMKKRPIVIVGVIQNKTSEHIAVGTFIGDMEREFVNSGSVEMVASAEEREAVRNERADQQDYSSEETMKKWGKEHGADYMMGGVINSILDQEKGDAVVFYQVDLNLVNLETNEKVWLGQKKIKKYIGRKKMGF
jgi:uncharacterized protein (TIGR02722 family)